MSGIWSGSPRPGTGAVGNNKPSFPCTETYQPASREYVIAELRFKLQYYGLDYSQQLFITLGTVSNVLISKNVLHNITQCITYLLMNIFDYIFRVNKVLTFYLVNEHINMYAFL